MWLVTIDDTKKQTDTKEIAEDSIPGMAFLFRNYKKRNPLVKNIMRKAVTS